MTDATAYAAVKKVLQGWSIAGHLPSGFSGIGLDSRQVREGNIFVAMRGTRRNGSDYIEDAIGRGALVIVSEDEVKAAGGVCVVRVPDARLALAQISAAFYRNPSAKLFVAGITGTNGKTTTAYIMRELLRRVGREAGMIGTVEYCIGNRVIPATRTTPEAPVLQQFMSQMITAGCDSAIMEVSSHSLIQKRAACIEFDVAVLTNLTRDHLDYHGDRKSYGEAKKLLFTGLSSEAVAVINADDELGAELLQSGELQCRIVSYGKRDDADFRIANIDASTAGSKFSLVVRGVEHRLNTNLIGGFNVYNIVASLAALEQSGIDMNKAMQSIKNLPTVPGRMEEVPNAKGLKVVVDYAHTDDALEQVLTALRETTEGRLILVFGCGGDRDRSKRAAMGAVAERLADYTVVTSDNPRKEKIEDIIAEIEKGFSSRYCYVTEPDRESAIRKALEYADSKDVVLIAGKGHENFQEFENTTVAFDDRQVVRKLLS